jgi:hypothetical protein
MLYSRLIVITCLVSMVVSVIMVSGASIDIGVENGDWVKYEVLGTVPQLAYYEWVRLEVQDINDTEITVMATIHYKNGEEETNTLSWDIESGREPWIIPANLNEGDEFQFRYENLIVNETRILTYAGASRTVNLLHLVKYEEYTEMAAYWDQTTGFLLELTLNNSSPGEEWSGGYKAIETNLWSTTPVLELTWDLSSERVTCGDPVTFSAEVKDQVGDPVEGAVVTVYIDEKAVDLTDHGNGYYQVDVDTVGIEDGTHTVTVSTHKEGYESDEATGTLIIERRILHVTVELSTDTATKGDIIAVSAEVKDLDENPIEEATVNATLGHKTIYLSDEGEGHYRGNIDTFDINKGTYTVEVVAEKEFCESAKNAETLTVKAAVPWIAYIGVAVVVILIVIFYLWKRR